MKNLERFNETQENELLKACDILSKAGFKLQIENGSMTVWPRGATIEMDLEEGMVLVPRHYMEEFEKRQEELENEDEEVVRDEDQLFREIISNGGDISEVCSSYEEILEIDDVNDAEYEFIENIVTNEEASVIIDKYYDLWCKTEDGGYIDEGVFELSNFLKNNQ